MKPLSQKALQVKESSTLLITAKAKAMKAAGENIIAFTAGEPDFDTPEHIKQAASQAAWEGFTKYTASAGIPELRKAICEKLKNDNGLEYDPSQIVVSNGAKHALSNVFSSIINDGDEIIIPAPYWLTYPELIILAGGIPVTVMTSKSTGYKPTVEQLSAAITPKTKAIVINSPNNPSSAVYSKNELKVIADLAVKYNLYVISDEIYEMLIFDQSTPHISIASLGKEIFDRTIVINGYSKSYAMTGWRVGYSACSKQIADVIGNIQSHRTSNINTLAQKAALAAETGDKTCVYDMRDAFKARRDLMFNMVQEIPALDALYPECAFYVFADISSICGKSAYGTVINNGADFANLLLEKQKVAIVPCGDFGCDNHIRLSFALSEGDIIEGMNRIKSFVEGI